MITRRSMIAGLLTVSFLANKILVKSWSVVFNPNDNLSFLIEKYGNPSSMSVEYDYGDEDYADVVLSWSGWIPSKHSPNKKYKKTHTKTIRRVSEQDRWKMVYRLATNSVYSSTTRIGSKCSEFHIF